MKKSLIAVIFIAPAIVFGQTTDNWGLPAQDPSANWGGHTDNLNPISPKNVHKLDKEQANPLNDSVIPKPTVANPFDSSGVYIGESQALTGSGVDPATGMTTPDTPRDLEN